MADACVIVGFALLVGGVAWRFSAADACIVAGVLCLLAGVAHYRR